MLDLFVSGLAIVVDFFDGWLGVGAAAVAEVTAPVCRGACASRLESCIGFLISSPPMLHASRDLF